MTPRDIQKLLDELTASRRSRKRAWEVLQEIRWVLKDTAGVELPAPKRKTIDLEGRVVKDGVRRAMRERQAVLAEVIQAIREFKKASEHPLEQGESGYAHALHELNGAIDRAERLLQ
jgi:soluble cytochrome b562